MNLGLYFSEYREITIIASFVAILGPLIVGPLTDHVAAKNPNRFGNFLRILTAIFLIITSIIYACLIAVPTVSRQEDHLPMTSFACDANGAIMFQQSCTHESSCRHWDKKVGSLDLTNCTYTCQDPNQYENMYTPWLESIPTPAPSNEQSSTESLEYIDENESADKSSRIYVEPPHICMTAKDDTGAEYVKNCHVYTDDTSSIMVNTVMRAATNVENDTHPAEWCHYPLGKIFGKV